jgi:uncharacterized protein YbcI
MPMNKPRPTLAQEIGEAAIAFQRRTTGRASKAVTVVLSQDTLVIMLHEALSPAERDLSKSPSGAAQVQEFHRQLFSTAAPRLQADIKRITGVEWRKAVAEVEPTSGDMVQVFTRNAEAQVLRLAQGEMSKGRRGQRPRAT